MSVLGLVCIAVGIFLCYLCCRACTHVADHPEALEMAALAV